MTKKKMRKLIIVGVLIFYIASLLMVFYTSMNSISSAFSNNFGNPVYTNQFEMFHKFEDEVGSKINMNRSSYNEGQLFAYYLSEYYGKVKYPFVMAVVDEDLNRYDVANNFVLICWFGDRGDQYISFDEYLSEDTKDEISKFIKKSKSGYYWIDELKVYVNGNEYIPVSMVLGYNGKNNKKLQQEFKITNYTDNLVLNKDTEEMISMWPYLRELEAPSYHRDNFKKYAEDLEDYMDANKECFSTNSGGGSMGGGECAYGCGYEINGKGYEIYVKGGVDLVTHTLVSDLFNYYAVYLAILFAIAGIVFYIMCMKVITKSEKLDEARNTFISGASHELKTPLAVIQNQCECILENIAPEKNEEYVKSIYDEAVRMNGIVSSLLSYNRLQQMTEIEKENCNLSELLREEVSSYRGFADNSGVTIEENIAENVYINCNAQLMKMAIDNYLSNAIKYAVGDKKVQVNLFRNKDTFTIAVINPAESSSADWAKTAWDEFTRGDKARQREDKSIGMGLPICKKIFELHSFKGYCNYNAGRISFMISDR